MDKIFIFIILMCVVLSLFAWVFLPGQEASFENSYKQIASTITAVGDIFNGMRQGLITSVQTIMSLPETIGNFFSHFGDTMKELFQSLIDTIGGFFGNLWGNIFNNFGKKPEPECTCEDPENCLQCECDSSDCKCAGKG